MSKYNKNGQNIIKFILDTHMRNKNPLVPHGNQPKQGKIFRAGAYIKMI
jgi:hypothetical protein